VRVFWTTYDRDLVFLLIGGILGFLTNWFFSWRSDRPKRFAWEFRSIAPLIQARAAHRGQLKVSYGDEDVTDPNVITVRVGNRGRKTIVADDFTQNGVIFDFGKARVLSSGINNDPWTVLAKLEQECDTTCRLKMPMLKKGQWLDMQFVTEGALEEPKVHPYFVGDELQVRTGDPTPRLWGLQAAALFALLMIALPYDYVAFRVSESWTLLLTFVVAFAGVVLFTTEALRRRDANVWEKPPS
jgi:hypothetical protein